MTEIGIDVNGCRHPLSLVIFDMDGTLTESNLNFAQIKAEARVPADAYLLEYVRESAPGRQAEIMAVIERHEIQEARSCALKPDTLSVLRTLKAYGLTLAILTRNCRKCSEIVVERFGLPIDAIFAREDAPPKPDAASVLCVCEHCGVSPARTLVIGDYLFDIQAGKGAGALAALLHNPKVRGLPCPADFVLEELSDLLRLLALA